MGTKLCVSIETSDYDIEFAAGVQVAGSIYSSESGGTSLRDLLFPAGPSVQPRTFQVPPGRYVVEAMLPNGEFLSDDVNVNLDQTSVVKLTATPSPRETHSWQHLLGNVVSQEAYFSGGTPLPASFGSFRAGSSGLRGENVGGYLVQPGPPGYRRHVSHIPNLYRVAVTGPMTYAILRDLESAAPLSAGDVAAMIDPDGTEAVVDRGPGDEFTQLYRFGDPDDHFQASLERRQYLVVDTGRSPLLVTLPVPWYGHDFHVRSIEVLVNLAESPNGSSVAVTVRDPSIGAGLAYLASGALSRAATVFGDVERMLWKKVTNPFAAAAAGYVLVGTESGSGESEWVGWLDNLKTWFPWMSDGAVLSASRRLRTAQSPADLAMARTGLLEACAAGLPVYTLGLSWLIDGLAQFGDDEECRDWLDQVRRVAWRVDTAQPFVTMRLVEGT